MLEGVHSMYSDNFGSRFSICSRQDTTVTTMYQMLLSYLLRYCYIQAVYHSGHSYMSLLYLYIVSVVQ